MGTDDNIVPGKILLLWIGFPPDYRPKDKYCILVNRDEYPLLLKISTSGKILEIAKRKKESKFLFKKSVYPGLDHDRFVDCGKIWSNLITLEEIINQVRNEPRRRIIGDVTEDHKREIIMRTEKSESISRIHKQVIRTCLGTNKSPA
jgi:hypothetical protein